MIAGGEPYALEYNARFGDPETQAVLPLLKSDLVEIMEATIDGRLSEVSVEWEGGNCVAVVAASKGYPGAYEKGREIKIGKIDGAEVFHAGDAFKDGKLVTSGGRVLAVSAKGKDIEEARKKAYSAIENISFDGMFYRRDIAEGVK